MENKLFFCGNELSEAEIKSGYISYATLAKCFDAVLCNEVMEHSEELGVGDDVVSGSLYEIDNDGNENWAEVYQWFIVGNNAVDLLSEANEIVMYSKVLNLYIWGVTHFGAPWVGVDTTLSLDDIYGEHDHTAEMLKAAREELGIES